MHRISVSLLCLLASILMVSLAKAVDSPVCSNENALYLRPVYLVWSEGNPEYEPGKDDIEIEAYTEGQLLICSGGYIFQIRIISNADVYEDGYFYKRGDISGIAYDKNGFLTLSRDNGVLAIFFREGEFENFQRSIVTRHTQPNP